MQAGHHPHIQTGTSAAQASSVSALKTKFTRQQKTPTTTTHVTCYTPEAGVVMTEVSGQDTGATMLSASETLHTE